MSSRGAGLFESRSDAMFEPWVEPFEGVPSAVDHNYFFGSLQELRDLLGFTAPLPPDCCDEIRQEIAVIKSELVTIKSRIAQGEINDMDKEARLKNVEAGGIALGERISEIEKLRQSVKDVL